MTLKMRVFKLTDEQIDMLIESVMLAYEMDIEERNDWNRETFDSMLNEVVGSYRTNYLQYHLYFQFQRFSAIIKLIQYSTYAKSLLQPSIILF